MCDWKGWYEQSGRQYEMTFQAFDVSETVKGKGSDAVGVFEITGYCETANGIQFLKHYKSAHTVLYNGTLDPDEQIITGRWSIGGYIGEPFKIYKVNKKESKRRWKGFYLYGGEKGEMTFKSLKFTQGKITGEGEDVVGQFTINGDIQPSGELQFVKQYVGQHSVLYKGLRTYDIIRGNWSIPECGSGDSFELTRVYY
ncbi:hypothetical protein EMCRGX_G023707 [Ephydatia muelleri]